MKEACQCAGLGWGGEKEVNLFQVRDGHCLSMAAGNVRPLDHCVVQYSRVLYSTVEYCTVQ